MSVIVGQMRLGLRGKRATKSSKKAPAAKAAPAKTAPAKTAPAAKATPAKAAEKK